MCVVLLSAHLNVFVYFLKITLTVQYTSVSANVKGTWFTF